MTDEELIARLRVDEPMCEEHFTANLAAYRIEALTKERDDTIIKRAAWELEARTLTDKLATCEKYRDAYDEMGRIGTQAVRDLEAKLAALVEAAEKVINSYWHSTDGVITGIYDLEAALARVKGVM